MWSIPKMWEGQPCVILASGESLTDEVVTTVRSAYEYRCIVINNTVERAPWADMLYAADITWWQVNKKLVEKFQGLKVMCADDKTLPPYPDVMQLKIGAVEGFNPDPSVLCTGGNSGYQALCIAVHAGCSRILLCGFDMRGGHWHGKHKPPLRETNPSLYGVWIKRFSSLALPLAERGVDVINCTPKSALKTWRYEPLEEALKIKVLA